MKKKLLLSVAAMSLMFCLAQGEAWAAGTVVNSALVDGLGISTFKQGDFQGLEGFIRANRPVIAALAPPAYNGGIADASLNNLDAAIRRLKDVLERRAAVLLSIGEFLPKIDKAGATAVRDCPLIEIKIPAAWHSKRGAVDAFVKVPYQYLLEFKRIKVAGVTARAALDQVEAKNIGPGLGNEAANKANGFGNVDVLGGAKYVPNSVIINGTYRGAENAKNAFAALLDATVLPAFIPFVMNPNVDGLGVTLTVADFPVLTATKQQLIDRTAEIVTKEIPNIQKLIDLLLLLRNDMKDQREGVWPQVMKDQIAALANVVGTLPALTEAQLVGPDGQGAAYNAVAGGLGHFAAHVSTLSGLMGGTAGAGDYYNRAYDFYHRFYDLPQHYHDRYRIEADYQAQLATKQHDLDARQVALDAEKLNVHNQTAATAAEKLAKDNALADVAARQVLLDTERAALKQREKELRRAYGVGDRLGKTASKYSKVIDRQQQQIDAAAKRLERQRDRADNYTRLYDQEHTALTATQGALTAEHTERARVQGLRDDYNRLYGDAARLYGEAATELSATSAALVKNKRSYATAKGDLTSAQRAVRAAKFGAFAAKTQRDDATTEKTAALNEAVVAKTQAAELEKKHNDLKVAQAATAATLATTAAALTTVQASNTTLQAKVAEQAAAIATLTAADKVVIKQAIIQDPALKKQSVVLQKALQTGNFTPAQKAQVTKAVNDANAKDAAAVKKLSGTKKGAAAKRLAETRKKRAAALAALKKVK